MLQPDRLERVVVRGANWVGDAVMTVPALRELRRILPRAHITLATRGWAEGVFAGADFLDDIMVTDKGARGFLSFTQEVGEWRRRGFDLAVLFPNAFQPALVAATARVPARIGYATHNRRRLLTHALAVPAWRDKRHEVFYYLNIIAELEQLLTGVSHVASKQPRFDLSVPEAHCREAREILAAHGAQMNHALVALCPGSTNSRAKRWPADRFAALADRLIEEMGAEVLLVGAGEELAVSEEVVRHMCARPVVLTGRTTLAQITAILSLADLLVTNDTGPAHIAASLNRPTLVIFGPTNPLTTRPFSSTAEIIRHPPDCAPCMLRDCPIDHRCMTAITPEEVFAHAVAMIGKRNNREAVRVEAAR